MWYRTFSQAKVNQNDEMIPECMSQLLVLSCRDVARVVKDATALKQFASY